MPYSDTVFLNLLSRVEHGFGRLEEGQKLNHLAAEQRAQHLEHQITEHRQETRAELREIRSKMERSKAPTLTTSVTVFFKAASLLAAHWRVILTVTLIVAGIAMGKSPEAIKAMVKTWVG